MISYMALILQVYLTFLMLFGKFLRHDLRGLACNRNVYQIPYRKRTFLYVDCLFYTVLCSLVLRSR